LILEKPHQLGQSLNGVNGLDIDVEVKVVRDKLSELQQLGATEDEIKMVMKNLGLTRFVKEILLE
jgi:fatty acyl-CoA reductase